jgi:hypothetical protein
MRPTKSIPGLVSKQRRHSNMDDVITEPVHVVLEEEDFVIG